VGSFNAVALGRSPVGWPRPANTGGRGFLAGYRFRLLNSLEVGYWNGDNRITRGQRPALSQCHEAVGISVPSGGFKTLPGWLENSLVSIVVSCC
jgi:hypothetical protein